MRLCAQRLEILLELLPQLFQLHLELSTLRPLQRYLLLLLHSPLQFCHPPSEEFEL